MDFTRDLLEMFRQFPQYALLISLCLSILVAIAGLLPSVFITAANIYFFGFWTGTGVSIAGEAAGAAISFLLYRYWFQQPAQPLVKRHRHLAKLADASGLEAAGLVVAMRLMPLVPSGFITLAAAIGKISFVWFVLASSLGKIPALLLEAALVQGFLRAGWPGQLGMVVAASIIAWQIIRKKKSSA